MTDALSELNRILAEGNSAAGLDYLIERFREEKEWPLVFEGRLMKKRQELGLPLIQTRDSSDFPEDLRPAYEQEMVEAAREVGQGFLAMGNIPRAWPYFRAIGESAPVVEAIERAQDGDDVDAVIAIAFQEGVDPAKGLELILSRHGMCRALTSFGMYSVQKDREKCIGLLVRELHAEILNRMGRAIESREGARPESTNLIQIMTGRDWLFGEYDYYVDTSHLVSLLPYCLEANSKETLRLFHELCEYGKCLAPSFQSRGQAPFENPCVDYGEYVQAMLGCDVDARIQHFRRISEESNPEMVGTAPAQFLVNLLVKLERFQEALEAAMENRLEDERDLSCPTVLQLCRLAGDYDLLKELALERRDLLSYFAAISESQAARAT